MSSPTHAEPAAGLTPADGHGHDHGPARAPAPYSNPYLAGIGLGLVLLTAFVVMGRGLGASGAVSSACAVVVDAVAPHHAEANVFWKEYLEAGVGHPLKEWLVFEVLGVLVGGFLSGLLAGRVRKTVEKGPRIGNGARFALAFLGGSLMGIGAKLARGCASGQALTGGALLSAGGWTFMMLFFAGAYGAAWFVRKEWL